MVLSLCCIVSKVYYKSGHHNRVEISGKITTKSGAVGAVLQFDRFRLKLNRRTENTPSISVSNIQTKVLQKHHAVYCSSFPQIIH